MRYVILIVFLSGATYAVGYTDGAADERYRIRLSRPCVMEGLDLVCPDNAFRSIQYRERVPEDGPSIQERMSVRRPY